MAAPAAACRLRFAALALALAAAASAASGAAPSAVAPPCRVEVGEETVQGRHHGPFSSLAVNDGIYAEAKLDSWRELNIFTYTSVAGRIRTEVVAGALNVSAEEGTCVTDTTVQISTLAPVDSASAFGGSGLVVEAVRGRVSASGGSNVSVGNLSSAANATLAAGNGSEVRVGSLTVGGELRILVAGQARVSVLSGRATSVVVDASGPATVRLGGLLAGRLEVVAGGAHVELPSADAAAVSCGSGGRLRLAGRPRVVQVLRQDGCEIVRGGGADLVELVQVPTTTEAVERATSTTPQAEATSTGPVSAAWAPHPALALPAAAVVVLRIR